jgi:ectoine hydroxylase-related dioxygenase (phytanoyl-CoA dioxygenase family)
MHSIDDSSKQIDRAGFAVLENVIDHATAERVIAAIEALPDGKSVRRSQSIYGVRNLLEVCSEVGELARSTAIRSLVTPILGQKCFAVRAAFFDKVPGANWKVPWHQDTAIVVRERIETEGFTAWSEKAGALHVQPPESVLLGMLAIRIHLDDCLSANGPLRVLAGSHTHHWPLDQLEKAKAQFSEVICEVAAGSVLALRPLLLHASSPSETPGHRRVVHIEYAAKDLPNGLEWRNRIA